MRNTAAVLILVASGLLSPSETFAQRIHLDAFAARVNGHVILESDVAFEIALMRMDPETRTLSLPDRATVVERLIDRELLLDQARKFITRRITESDVVERMNDLDLSYGGIEARKQFLSVTGRSEEFWRLRIRNLVMLDKYVDQRFRAFVRISREDEDNYIRKNADKLKLENFTDPVAAVPEDHPIRVMIRNLLTETDINKRIDELLQQLRASADISRIGIEQDVPGGSPAGTRQ